MAVVDILEEGLMVVVVREVIVGMDRSEVIQTIVLQPLAILEL